MPMIKTSLGLSLVSSTQSQRESEPGSKQLIRSSEELDLLPSQPVAAEHSISFSLLTPSKRLLSAASSCADLDDSQNFEKCSSASRSLPQSPAVDGDPNVCFPAKSMALPNLSIQTDQSGKDNSAKRDCENDITSGINVEGTSDAVEKRNPRKKLRLSKKQSLILEESFKKHNTLNLKQKNVLAEQLNLKARQVEVWFQNRRARTKFRQTEVNCEFLKRCCESLRQENRRLQQELQELRTLKAVHSCLIPHHFHTPLPASSICPSCDRLGRVEHSNLRISGSFTKKVLKRYRQPSAPY
ncbi:hypothetical protein O6H91_06G060800 [Diphasiastrum complanatum]|uniref:Uncharacterized protein n=2 Tax=Diphasiastrum complanatum TaxID=34168 RepID=A0ACC2DE10_DIPCM|nr:hypothetical protein O6H91_06G060800 [Diphasiastrum complanatum]KAJ7552584.1 hypothetical protein O6H91_06G060800 [Diphasiastrum complanatum]